MIPGPDDPAGNATFKVAVAVPAGSWATATATRSSTSEFSKAVKVRTPTLHGGLNLGLVGLLRLNLGAVAFL